ncbi:MAG: beta-ketoacyl synthase [Gammaproteobacteria bacterium]|nr:beta-ketoacyl synthase [Gammaproteobacteria bacterium]MDE0366650.1 beta-ketoacyl synthase [Gammaproteobacteria bacterium]
MSRLPVIVGFGGINPAGRISFHHAYRRLVVDVLGEADRARTYRSLAALMNLQEDSEQPDTRRYIDDHTLIRRIELFDPESIRWNREASLAAAGAPLEFVIARRQLPAALPDGWRVEEHDARSVKVTVNGTLKTLLPDRRVSRVSSAGQAPTGFDPAALYPARSHPRGLQLTVFGASDTIRSSGLSLELLKRKVAPDQFAAYSTSALSQMDPEGYGGMLQNAMLGKRVTSKCGALGLPEMPGDFVNAYVLGSVGGTGGILGACATFLYSVKQGVEDIRSGARRVVVAGNAEAPILPDVIEAYRTMGALSEDEAIMELDGTDVPDLRRTCRPFSSNAGFTAGEAAIYVLMMDDELAMELGAEVLGSVPGVYINADGYKKSIPGPGVGNYLTVAKAMALARSILGDEGLRRGTHIQAHGTGTPQNRVTESHILNELARINGIEKWLVSAAKAYVGHTMAAAGGDQLASAMGAWEHGWVPGITTIDHIAEDVYDSNLHLPMQHVEIDPAAMPGALINSKGFGGNNATALFLSPDFSRRMLERRWGKAAFAEYQRRNEAVRESRSAYDAAMLEQTMPSIYRFGEGVLEGEDLTITSDSVQIPGFEMPVSLDIENPYGDMLEP